MSAPVFLAEPGALDGFGPGHSYLLDGAEGATPGWSSAARSANHWTSSTVAACGCARRSPPGLRTASG